MIDPDDQLLVQVAITTAPVSVAVATATQPVQVAVTEAAPGPAGANATIVILTLAEYLALSPEAQMDGTWYVIPKT